MVDRKFVDTPAKRASVPLLVSLVGPSKGGKTKSALRLATGMQRVSGGDIFHIDTETRRALHYAHEFRFRHVPFEAPFSPLAYLAACEHCVRQGARTIIIDSFSHEHEGPGGVLEMFEEELYRIAGDDNAKAERSKMLAWQKPKAQRRRLINTLMQMPVNIIMCCRAQDKFDLEKGFKRGEPPPKKGYMPITGSTIFYEWTVGMLLPPDSRGVPQWDNLTAHQKVWAQPGPFTLLPKRKEPLDESVGEKMAQWAAGDAAAVSEPSKVRDDQADRIEASEAQRRRDMGEQEPPEDYGREPGDEG